MLYDVLRGCSCRLSPDEADPDFHRFQDWLPGEVLDTDNAPDHIDLEGLWAVGAIELREVTAPASAKGSSVAQGRQDGLKGAGAVVTDAGATGAAPGGSDDD